MVKSPESFGPASPTRQRGGWARLKEVEVQSLGSSRVLIVVGVAGFLTGAIDLLEGSMVGRFCFGGPPQPAATRAVCMGSDFPGAFQPIEPKPPSAVV